MKGLGLRGRVTLAAVVALGAALVVASVGFNLLLSKQLDSDVSAVLTERADAQLATIDTRGGRIRTAESPGDETLDMTTWIFTPRGTLEQPRARADAQRAARGLAGTTHREERTVSDRLRLLGEPVRDSAGRQLGTVVVGTSLLPYEDTQRIAMLATIALSLLVLLAAALVVRRAVGAALRPVAEMTERAADWSEHDLHRRFDLGPPGDELTGLGATLDGLLERIDSALRHEQRFSAEMAHELRTPLSGVRARAELALAEGSDDAERRLALERVLAGTDRMAAAIDALMASAPGAAGGPPGLSDPHVALTQAVEGFRDRGVEVALLTRAGEARVEAEHKLIAQAVSPLLDNAVRHARSRVEVSVEPAGARVAIVVADDGDGIATADAERIFDPGVSLRGGAGLGLSLSRRLAIACGGEAVAVSGEHGRVELRLPGRSGNSHVAAST